MSEQELNNEKFLGAFRWLMEKDAALQYLSPVGRAQAALPIAYNSTYQNDGRRWPFSHLETKAIVYSDRLKAIAEAASKVEPVEPAPLKTIHSKLSETEKRMSRKIDVTNERLDCVEGTTEYYSKEHQ